MDDRDLRAVADYLFDLAERERAGGQVVRATALEHVAEDYEAELAVRSRAAASPAGATPLRPAS